MKLRKPRMSDFDPITLAERRQEESRILRLPTVNGFALDQRIWEPPWIGCAHRTYGDLDITALLGGYPTPEVEATGEGPPGRWKNFGPCCQTMSWEDQPRLDRETVVRDFHYWLWLMKEGFITRLPTLEQLCARWCWTVNEALAMPIHKEAGSFADWYWLDKDIDKSPFSVKFGSCLGLERGSIYVHATEDRSRVKIGYTRRRVRTRMREHEQDIGRRLEVIAQKPGTVRDERLLQVAVSRWHSHGEWFDGACEYFWGELWRTLGWL